MITSSNAVGFTMHELRELRQMAMTGARVARALDDAELLRDQLRQARTMHRLIIHSRAALRTGARVS